MSANFLLYARVHGRGQDIFSSENVAQFWLSNGLQISKQMKLIL